MIIDKDRVAENAQLLRPPINNYCAYQGDATVMILGMSAKLRNREKIFTDGSLRRTK